MDILNLSLESGFESLQLLYYHFYSNQNCLLQGKSIKSHLPPRRLRQFLEINQVPKHCCEIDRILLLGMRKVINFSHMPCDPVESVTQLIKYFPLLITASTGSQSLQQFPQHPVKSTVFSSLEFSLFLQVASGSVHTERSGFKLFFFLLFYSFHLTI